MRKDVAKYLGLQKELVDIFFDNFLIDPKSAKRFLVTKEYELLRSTTDKSNSQIYFELSEKHEICENTVYKWVTNYF